MYFKSQKHLQIEAIFLLCEYDLQLCDTDQLIFGKLILSKIK